MSDIFHYCNIAIFFPLMYLKLRDLIGVLSILFCFYIGLDRMTQNGVIRVPIHTQTSTYHPFDTGLGKTDFFANHSYIFCTIIHVSP